MMKTDIEDLLKRVEEERQRLHPELQRGFLMDIVNAEELNPEDDEEALRLIEESLRQHVGSEDGSDAIS